MTQLAALVAIAWLVGCFIKTIITPTDEEKFQREALRRYYATKPPMTLKEAIHSILLIVGAFAIIIIAMSILQVYYNIK